MLLCSCLQVEDEVGQVVTVLVQNKIDLIEESVVTAEEVEELAKRLKLKKVYRTSVKENFNVEEGRHVSLTDTHTDCKCWH